MKILNKEHSEMSRFYWKNYCWNVLYKKEAENRTISPALIWLFEFSRPKVQFSKILTTIYDPFSLLITYNYRDVQTKAIASLG